LSISEAVAALRAGRLVILPTETVYGLAADAGNDRAVAGIYQAKGRPSFNPLIAHVADSEAAQRVAVFDERAIKLATVFWPGPLTIVAPARERGGVCELARAGLDTVAVRVPGHRMARELLTAFGGPIVAPSANRSGRPSPTSFQHAMAETGDAAGAALDGGDCTIGLESTVVSALPGEPLRLLRPGAVTREQIEAVAGPLAEADADAKRSPGRLARHYAPDALVRLNATDTRPGEVLIGFGAIDGELNLSPSGDLAEAAANLFRLLRAADRLGPITIAIAPVPLTGLGEAINDRLIRAAGHVG
jgi:L-threonylcarbamoyladenylate synthase